MFWFFGPKACGILAPRLGMKPTLPALEGEVLTTGLPGKSQKFGVLSHLILGEFVTQQWITNTLSKSPLLCCPFGDNPLRA